MLCRSKLFSLVEVVLFGAVAGFTIFIGLPLAFLQRVQDSTKGLLNALSMGILFFIVIEVLHESWEKVSSSLYSSFIGQGFVYSGILNTVAMFGGIGLGLVGLSVYESSYMSRIKETQVSPLRIATMIALGIGAHNFSEGLAIGQSYASGAISLALVLVIGFGIHNATEGFGIIAPLVGEKNNPPVSFIGKVGLIGGGPTFLGTLVGSIFFSELSYVFFLSLAGGALIYVITIMYAAGRKQATNQLMMTGIFLGLLLGFLTDLIVSFNGI